MLIKQQVRDSEREAPCPARVIPPRCRRRSSWIGGCDDARRGDVEFARRAPDRSFLGETAWMALTTRCGMRGRPMTTLPEATALAWPALIALLSLARCHAPAMSSRSAAEALPVLIPSRWRSGRWMTRRVPSTVRRFLTLLPGRCRSEATTTSSMPSRLASSAFQPTFQVRTSRHHHRCR